MKRLSILLVACIMMGGCASTAGGFSSTSTPSFKAASTPDRTIVVISDLHLGLGRDADDSRDAKEDFRWPKAFKAFLDEISKMGNQRVDLVIAGDFLEMWQPPANIYCKGASAGLGCTIDEMKEIAIWITRVHSEVFNDLKNFSQKDQNRLYIIPGNHDAALLAASVWAPIGKALDADKGRVCFVSSGIWTSADGSIVVEHGHQIGSDANRYKTWPNIGRTKGGIEYIIRPWGERFVQKIFNDQEKIYPIIDNLSPESAGVSYRMADRGKWGTGKDIAQFLAFNLFQTSLPQMAQVLGTEESPEDKPKWDISEARKLGHRLFVAALSEDDGFRAQLLENSDQAKEVRRELDMLANDPKRLPDENIKMLCDQAAIQENSVCKAPELGAFVEKKLVPREWVLASHLSQKEKDFPRMRYFVYGHTHLFEEAWQPSGTSYVQVLNSGAFQRLINEKGYLRRVNDRKISPAEGLKKIALEELPPCYTCVLIPYNENPQVLRWVMKESDNTGSFAKPGDNVCE